MLIDLAIKLVGKSALDELDVFDNLESETNIKICTSLDKTDYDRKPNPGMLEKLIKQYRTTPDQTLMVGDMESDRLAAENAGCDFIWAWDLFGFEKEN